MRSYGYIYLIVKEQSFSVYPRGADRARTDDLRLAKPPLSQLSYSPEYFNLFSPSQQLSVVVGLGRFELPTSRLSGVRSNQLSYRPDALLMLSIVNFEP